MKKKKTEILRAFNWFITEYWGILEEGLICGARLILILYHGVVGNWGSFMSSHDFYTKIFINQGHLMLYYKWVGQETVHR